MKRVFNSNWILFHSFSVDDGDDTALKFTEKLRFANNKTTFSNVFQGCKYIFVVSCRNLL